MAASFTLTFPPTFPTASAMWSWAAGEYMMPEPEPEPGPVSAPFMIAEERAERVRSLALCKSCVARQQMADRG